MSLISFLFGEWVVIHESRWKAQYVSALFCREWEEDIAITIERHTRTHKDRAFIHRINGTKQKTSLVIAKRFFSEVMK